MTGGGVDGTHLLTDRVTEHEIPCTCDEAVDARCNDLGPTFN